MSTRQLEASEFAAHWLEHVAAFKTEDTVVELTHGGKVVATITPAEGSNHLPSACAPNTEQDLLELACQAYASGRVSREVAASFANLSRSDFDQALFDRRIPSYDEARLAQDRETLRSLRNR